MNAPQLKYRGETFRHYVSVFARKKWFIVPMFVLISTISFFGVQKSRKLVTSKTVNVVLGIHQQLQESARDDYQLKIFPKIELLRSREFLKDVVKQLSLRFCLKNISRSLLFDSVQVSRNSLFDSLQVRETAINGDYQFSLAEEQNVYYLTLTNKELGYDKKTIRTGRLSNLKYITIPGFFSRFSDSFLKNPFNFQFRLIPVQVAINDLLKVYTISQPNNIMSGHFTISLKGTDFPSITHTINHIADYFIEQDILLRKERTDQTAVLLQKQLNTANEQRIQSLQNLQNFLSRHPDVALDQQLEHTVSALVELKSDQFKKINLTHEAKRLMVNYMESQREDRFRITGEIMTFLNAQEVSTLSYLIEDFNNLLIKRNELQQTYARNHPLRKGNLERISRIEEKAVNMLDKYIDNIQRTHKMEKEHIQSLTRKANRLPSNYLRLAELKRTHQIHSDGYSAILEKYNEAKMASSIEMADFYIIDKAMEPLPDPMLLLFLKIVAISFLAGLTLSAGPVFAYEFLKSTVSTSFEMDKYHDMKLLETFPTVSEFNKKKKKAGTLYTRVAALDPTGRGGEMLESTRSLVTKLFLMTDTNRDKSFVFISLEPSSGKSTVAANTAAVMARENRPTLLIDGDMRKGVQSDIFEFPSAPGLSDLLKHKAPLSAAEVKECVHVTKIPNLHILTCGSYNLTSSELISNNRMEELKELVSSLYDVIILDTPPLGVCADSAVVSKLFTCFIAVALAGKTPIPTLRKKIAEYPDLQNKIAGLVLNKAPVTRENGYYRYAAYYRKEEDNNSSGLKI